MPISELTPVVIENIVETEAFANSPTPTPTLTPLPASTPDPPTLSQNIQQDPPARQEKILSITSSASLNDALKKYDKGKLVLKAYEKSQCLEKKFSLMLCDIILLHEFDGNPNTYLSTKQFASLTKSITELFPNEKAESYFIPNRTVNGSMVRARGRLLDKYENRLKAFRGVGLIGSRRQKTSAQVPLETSGTLSILFLFHVYLYLFILFLFFLWYLIPMFMLPPPPPPGGSPMGSTNDKVKH